MDYQYKSPLDGAYYEETSVSSSDYRRPFYQIGSRGSSYSQGPSNSQGSSYSQASPYNQGSQYSQEGSRSRVGESSGRVGGWSSAVRGGGSSRGMGGWSSGVMEGGSSGVMEGGSSGVRRGGSLEGYPGQRAAPPPQTNYRRYVDPISSPQPKYSNRHKPSAYPRELTVLFGPLNCKLCGVDVPSPIVAKMHYSGKQHSKKIKSYLLEWSQRTGLPMPELEEPFANSSVRSKGDYCEVCDVQLCSINDKVLHYSGKSHQKNERDPSNARKRKRGYDTIDVTASRFGIGSDFEPVKTTTDKKGDELVSYKDCTCNLCNVKAVSEDQLEMHLQGKKHKDKFAKHSESKESKEEKKFPCKICDVGLPTRALLRMHLAGKRHAKNSLKLDLDGSGADFCDVCQVTFTCYEMYQAHVIGKKHEKKCKEKYSEAIKVKEESCEIACKFCPFVGNVDGHKCDKSLLNIDLTNLEKKWICFPCHNMVFESEPEYNEHKNTRRHTLCMLNQEHGDKVNMEFEHWYCEVCKKQYHTNADYTNHLFEEKHKSLSNAGELLESRTDMFKCNVCDLVMDEQAKDEHMKNRVHLRKSLKIDTISSLAKLANEEITTNTFNCANCHVVLNSFFAYSNHMLGEEHVERMINIKLRQ